jgi:alpha/beta superfamily hydrolase
MISTSTPAAPAKTAGNATLRSFTIKGPAGRLEALLNQGIANAPYAAVVCHPHLKGGGTLHNKVVYHAMKALNAPEFGLGWPVLRFNFRGIGISEGGHDGEAEAGDVLAAIDWIENEFNRPIVVVGFSFGAAMALLACCSTDSRKARTNLRALAALGLPTRAEGRTYSYSFLSEAETATSSRLPQIYNVWPPPRSNPKSWCSYRAPITFLQASLKRCKTNSPAGSRSSCRDTRE